jgi:long-subunit acyl-CoA synthetase (AMP-forming)
MVEKVCYFLVFSFNYLYCKNVLYLLLILDKLERFEIPTAIILCIDVWTPDNNLVTAAFKLKRREIYAKYKTQIDNLYES